MLIFIYQLKEKLCCMIAGNKVKSGKNELYSERKKAIRWFEKNFPKEFDLFGMGWDEYPVDLSGSIVSKVIRKIQFLNKVLARLLPVIPRKS